MPSFQKGKKLEESTFQTNDFRELCPLCVVLKTPFHCDKDLNFKQTRCDGARHFFEVPNY